MSRLQQTIFGIAALTLVCAFVASQPGVRSRPSEETTTEVDFSQKHLATAEMIAKSRSLAGKPAFPFQAKCGDGNLYSLNALLASRPVVLVFIKDGCPCSKAAQPYFNKLYLAAGGRVDFLGIIDGDESVAARWASENATRFPVLADPEKSIIHAFEAPNSAYSALIDRGGTIQTLWAGYSVEMIHELSSAMARLTGALIAPVDVTDAPESLYSGCPFD